MRPFFAVASQLRRQVARPRSSAARSFSNTVHRNAGIGEAHRDAAAHRAEAEDGRRADRPRRRVLRDVRNLRRRALGEERVPQRLRLRRLHEFDEVATLARQAVVERLRDGGLDRVDALQRRRQAARLFARPRRAPRRRTPRRRRRQAAPRCGRAAWDAGCASSLRPRTAARRRRSPAIDDALDQPVSSASAAGIGSPLTIIRRPMSAPTARGSRCVPPAPGSRPIFTSGRPSDASGVAIAVVAAERELEAAAHAHAVDRGDHRLGRTAPPHRSAAAGSARPARPAC